MKKLKLLIILIVIIILIVAVRFFSTPEYSFDDIVNLLDKSDKATDNMSIKVEDVHVNGTKYTEEIYAKDDIIYVHNEDIENMEITNKTDEIWNYDDKSINTIYYSTKTIASGKIEGNGKSNPVTNILIGFSRKLKSTPKRLYKYYGITENDGKKFLKFSIESEDSTSKLYFYINLEDENVLKTEIYRNNEHESTTTITYSYGTVTDDDIFKFDINNYADYKYEK